MCKGNFAHEAREDGCHSPVEVLAGHKGTMYPPSVLDRILFAQALHAPPGHAWVAALSKLEALRGARAAEGSRDGVGL